MYIKTDNYILDVSDDATRLKKVIWCSSSSLRIPDGISIIEKYSATRLSIEQLVIPSDVTSIEDKAFCDCKKLKNVVFKDYELTNKPLSFGAFVFSGCNSLTSISLPERTNLLFDNSLSEIPNLKKITIPASLKEISHRLRGDYMELPSLNYIAVSSENQNIFDFRGVLFSLSALLRVPQSYSCQIQGTLNSSIKVILNSVRGIEDHAFRGTNIEVCIVPKNIAWMGIYAFADCKFLQHIDLSATNLSHIAAHAFSGCSNLREVILPIDAIIIGSESFADCFNLRKIVLSPKIWRIHPDAFLHCDNLLEIEFAYMEDFHGFLFDSIFDLPPNPNLSFKCPYKMYDNLKLLFPNNEININFGD